MKLKSQPKSFKAYLPLLCLLIFQTFAHRQNKANTGTAKDEDGLPIPGVNIIVKGKTTGTQSDFDSHFEISVT